jgi:hypothetical protein
MRKRTSNPLSSRIFGSLKLLLLGFPMAAVAQTIQKKLEFIPDVGGYRSIAILAANIGSQDTLLIFDWKLGDPAPDSIIVPASLNDSFDLEIVRKNPGGREQSDSFRYRTGKNGLLPR